MQGLVKQNINPWAAGVDVTAARHQRNTLHHQAWLLVTR